MSALSITGNLLFSIFTEKPENVNRRRIMITQYFLFSISITISSWIVGLVVNSILEKQKFYREISHLNPISNKKLNKVIGLDIFKWIVKNTFFKYFNQKIKLQQNSGIDELVAIRKEMTIAELGHFTGFAVVSIAALVVIIQGNYLFASILMIVNIFMNLYPSLLQQENKRRIDILIARYGRGYDFHVEPSTPRK